MCSMCSTTSLHSTSEGLVCRYCRIVAAEVLSFLIPIQARHPALASLALLQPLMRLITIYHEPGVRPGLPAGTYSRWLLHPANSCVVRISLAANALRFLSLFTASSGSFAFIGVC